jgi:putative transposase
MPTPQRLQWLFTEYPIYFLTACTDNRRRILERSDVHETFIQFGLRASTHGIWVGRYVIMPDHIHLFASFGPDSKSVSTWMKSLKNGDFKDPESRDFVRTTLAEGIF